MIFSQINHRGIFDNSKEHDGSGIQTIATCK